MGVESGADRGAAEIDLGDERDSLVHPVGVLADGDRERAELLPQRHRHGILQLRTSEFEHVAEFDCLVGTFGRQFAQCVREPTGADSERHLHGSGVDVVGALSEVDVFERVQHVIVAASVPEQFERPVRDHLVGVHVGRRPRAALDLVDDELLVKRSGADFGACRDDRVGNRGIE